MPTINNIDFLTLPQQVMKNRRDLATLSKVVENEGWELFDVIYVTGDMEQFSKDYPQYNQTNTDQLKLEGYTDDSSDFTSLDIAISPTLADVEKICLEKEIPFNQIWINARLNTPPFNMEDATLYLYKTDTIGETSQVTFLLYKITQINCFFKLYRKVKA